MKGKNDKQQQQLQTINQAAKDLKKRNPTLELATQKKAANRAELVLLEGFTKTLNSKPQTVKVNKFANGSKYVPISAVQTTLDKLFFGLWQTKDFKYQVIANELVGQVDLWVKHPFTGEWLTRVGVAATQIRQNKGAALTDIGAKIKNGLEMDAPHLYADCIKSAAKQFGCIFGRDLNREFTDNYKAIVTASVARQTYTIAEVKEHLQQLGEKSKVWEYFNSNPDFSKDQEVQQLCGTRVWELENRGA